MLLSAFSADSFNPVTTGERTKRVGGEIKRSTHLQIKFSRHAKRRADLYRIPEATIAEIIENKELNEGKHEIIQDIETLKYPLKIVVVVKNDIITVISSYPLKKGRKT